MAIIVQKISVWIKLTNINETSNPANEQEEASKNLLLCCFKSLEFIDILHIIRNRNKRKPRVPCSYNNKA